MDNQTNKTENLENQIEALLFYQGEPLAIEKISKILEKSSEQIEQSLITLTQNLQSRGIRLSRKENEVALVTCQEMSEVIKKIRKDELDKDLSKAAMETLSIIIYRGPIKRAEIDYIRGVNSQFILRLLLIRGLIEKVTNPQDERGFLYKASFDLINHLGLNKIEDISNYGKINEAIDSFIESENVDE